ncbi:sugar O-acetyltransferase [Marinimicrobium agarilyticum]|uniref:sugar O-acetyltransferase n=1 Tax=Marinimicrobium agarilyticum TaxID=306546 RepID=UPI0004282DF5|nr:sugar O-acetyltransferase [Marinimicrobium agarilyticum]
MSAEHSEWQKMLAGERYNPMDPELMKARRDARLLTESLNASRDNETKKRRKILRELIPNGGGSVWMQPPFYCDYGRNITLGENVFFNFNCVILDVAEVRIGARTLFGPAAQVYTATHPMDARERASGLELGFPITIGEDVWVGGGAIICPGVTIGDRSVIGAGSVVTKDIPADVFAAGNPCKVVRELANVPEARIATERPKRHSD